MIEKEMDIINSIDAAQVRFMEANEAGLELGQNGEVYVSPFEAIPEICSDPKNKLDRFVAFHYDRGYLTAYGHYLNANPGAPEALSYRRLVKKYCLVDKAQALGIAAYQEGRSGDDVVAEVYEMLTESESDINLSLYDGWEFGYALGLVYDKGFPKMTFPDFDYERAYDLSRSEEGEETGIPVEVLSAYRNAKNIAEASEDDDLIECLTCPYHYGIHKGDACDRDCYEAALTIHMMIGAEDDVLRGWLVHM